MTLNGQRTNEKGKDRNRIEAPRNCGRAHGFDGEFGNGSGGILRPVCSDFERKYSTRPLYYREKMATNEEAIKDVQDAQSNLTQAIQILTEFLCEEFLCHDRMFR